MKKTNNSGFSLVELIIVIAIMAVLIGVLAPQFIKYVAQSRESTDLQNITEVKTAVEAFAADNELDPSTKITVTGTNGGNIVVSGMPTGKDLKEYGIDDAKPTKMKAKWSSNIVWDYENYKWTTSTTAVGSTYNQDGTKKGAVSSS